MPMPLPVVSTGRSPLGAGPAPEVPPALPAADGAAALSPEAWPGLALGSALPRLATEMASTSRVTTRRTVSRVRTGLG